MEIYFVLDENGNPLQEKNQDAWDQWFSVADRHVKRTFVTPEVSVLTTFSGVWISEDDSTPPRLYMTRVFGGALDGQEKHYATKEEALVGHAEMADWCRIGTTPDMGISEEDISEQE